MIWSPEAFLNEFGSTLLIKFRCGPEKAHDVRNTQKQWLQTKCQRIAKDVQLYINQVLHIFIFILFFLNNLYIVSQRLQYGS